MSTTRGRIVSLVTSVAAMLLVSCSAQFLSLQEQQDCSSGPAPPGDLRAFIWVNSGFEPRRSANEEAARERLRVDFLCQDTINGLSSSFSTLIPIPDIDFGGACSVPLDDACTLLSSCSSDETPRAGRRLTQCFPIFNCKVTLALAKRAGQLPLAPGEIFVKAPEIGQTMRPNVTLGICFEGECNILSPLSLQRDIFGALAYRLCPRNFVNTTVNGWTALHWTVAMVSLQDSLPFFSQPFGGIELSIKTLVENGANLEARDPQGFTPLHLASKLGRFAPLLSFLDAGADLEAMDNMGNTPLATASYFGQLSTSTVLVNAGANPNVTYFDATGDSALAPNSKTPLHFAALYVRGARLVEALIEAGADVNAVDDSGNTPLEIAEKYRRPKVIDILKENGAI